MSTRTLIQEALRLLGKRRFVLSIHDGSFPSQTGEEIGRGTPYSRGGRAFIEYAARLGFNGIQFGPQGQTDRGNPSPYDGSAFSRNVLSIAVASLRSDSPWGRLVDERELAAASRTFARGGRDRVHHERAYDAQKRLLAGLHERYEQLKDGGAEIRALASAAADFRRRRAAWLEPDSLYEALAAEHGTADWTRWPEGLDRRLFCPQDGEARLVRRRREELRRRHGRRIERYELEQFLAHYQHEALHREAAGKGLALYADLQIGLSPRDAWALQPLFLSGYRLGAPPSRTTASGQPWGYFVFDPQAYTPDGTGRSVLEHLRLRADKLFEEYDGLRIDHPQGLVCPWVYRTDDLDLLHAVQHGARLFESPDLPDHPQLRRYARVLREQLSTDPSVLRHHDGWVRELDPEQVERYATLVAEVAEAARAHGRDHRDIACEILSTLPYPLARVIERFGLGRFRVTQKASLSDPADVYRGDNAGVRDWIMMGNHDTPPIWRVVDSWRSNGELAERAGYLAARLAPGGGAAELRASLAADPGRLVHAQLAEALLSRAENVLVFFADLFGLREVFNDPGTFGPHNWSLRVPPDYRRSYPERASRLEALNLPYALALALRSRMSGPASTRTRLIERLEEASRVFQPAR